MSRDSRRADSLVSHAPPVIDGRNTTPSIPARLWLLGLVGLVALAAMIIRFNVPLPQCGMRTLIGVPCPFCGGTRTLALLAEFNFARAMTTNPLVALTILASAAWFAFAAVARRRRVAILRPFRIERASRRHWVIAAIAVAINWVYLWFTLPV